MHDSWYGLYGSRWNSVVVGDSVSHPAKFSRGLIEKIFSHAKEEGWVEDGNFVLDPFGGIGLGGYVSMRYGLNWIGVEVEEKIVNWAKGNIDYWNENFGMMPNWGTANVIHGDSRNVVDLVGKYIDISISSPPFVGHTADGGWQMLGRYAEQGKLTVKQVGGDPHKSFKSWDKDRDTYYGQADGQLANMKDGGFDIAVSSPPYGDISQSGGTDGLRKHGTGLTGNGISFGEYGRADGQLGVMPTTKDGFDLAVSSPPYADVPVSKNHMTSSDRSNPSNPEYRPSWKRKFEEGYDETAIDYGHSDGQLSDMKARKFDLAVSSPPYAETRIGQESGQEQCGHNDAYGEEEGQLGSMKANGFDIAISSPPFENVTADRPSKQLVQSGLQLGKSSLGDGYGDAEGQLGASSGNDFWIAAREIVDGVYASMRPGGHAIWVVKKYVKNKKLVHFDRMWGKLCVAAGFRVLHWHRAWVVEEVSSQYDMFGNLHTKTITRKSFFRQLAEKKGSPEINWETVICMEKPS